MTSGIHRHLLTACGTLLLTLGLNSAASAQTCATTTLSFNDLGASTGGTHMPDSYGCMRWTTSNWHFMTNASTPNDPYLALSGSATAIMRQDGQAFLFDGADLWSRRGLDAAGVAYYVLSLKGKVVYNGLTAKDGKLRFTGEHLTFKPAYSGPVDVVAIAFSKPGRGGDWDQLAMDNLRVRPAP